MYRHILVGLDGSTGAQEAFESAMELASVHAATLTVLSVEEHLPVYAASVGEVEETARELTARFHHIQRAAVQRAAARRLTVDSLIYAGSAAQTITRAAQAGGYDLIVIGAGKHGSLWNGLLGSTADRVVETAPCSVLVVRHSPLSIWAGEVMQRAVMSVQPTTPIAEFVTLLLERGVKAAPVVDQSGEVVGIITGGDLLERGGLSLRLSLHRQVDPATLRDQLAQLSASGQIASDVMTPDVTTISERTPLREAARLMAQQHIKRLPVLDAHGRLAGILSRADVLRHVAAIAPVGPSCSDDSGLTPAGARYVSDVLDPNVLTVTPLSRLDEVVSKVIGAVSRRVVVVNEQRHVIGIITDADLIGRLSGPAHAGLLQMLRSHIPFLGGDAAGQQALVDLHEQRALDVMRRDPYVIAASASIVEAIRVMMEQHVKRLPVVDHHGRLVGIVDRQALLRALSQMA